jgi:hypothetical protein
MLVLHASGKVPTPIVLDNVNQVSKTVLFPDSSGFSRLFQERDTVFSLAATQTSIECCIAMGRCWESCMRT